MKDLGLIGLGVMGAAMASNLIEAGFSLRVWNRTASKAAPLVERGARHAETPAEAAAGAEAVISIVADDEALRRVTYGNEGILYSLSSGAIHLSMSTASPEAAVELARAHTERGSHLLAAPIFGSKGNAIARNFWVIASGASPEVFERCRPIFDAISAGAHYCGAEANAAPRLKLIGNILISSAVATMAQAFALAEGLGLGADEMMEVIGHVFNSPLYERYGTRLVSRDFEVFFPLKLMLKDLRLALEMAASVGVPLPHASATREMVVAAIGCGFADADAAGSLLRTWEARG